MYATARYLAGLSLDVGFPVKIDITLAVQLFERCIDEQNHVGAMYDLAKILHEYRFGIKSNLSRAAELYLACAAYGYQPAISAMYDLARELGDSIGRLNQPSEADGRCTVQLYERCMAVPGTHQFNSMRDLAHLLTRGMPGVEKDFPRAVRLYQRFIDESNDTLTMISLAQIYASGAEGVPRDPSRTMQLCHEAVEEQCRNGVYSLGKKIAFGEGDMQKDVQLGEALLKLCIDKWDLPLAKITLANVYISGTPNANDLGHALLLFNNSLKHSSVATGSEYTESMLNNAPLEVRCKARDLPLKMSLYRAFIDKFHELGSVSALPEIGAADGTRVQDIHLAVQACRRPFTAQVLSVALELASGTGGVAHNFPLAVFLCRQYMAEDFGKKGRSTFTRVLLSGTRCAETVERAFSLCTGLCDTAPKDANCTSVLGIAEDLARGTTQITRNLSLAIRLSEMCAKRANDEHALGTLMRIILANDPEPEQIESGVELFAQMAKRKMYCPSMLQFVREVWSGTSEISRDEKLAIELCEILVEQSHRYAMVDLAEFMLLGETGARNMHRGVQLCREYLDQPCLISRGSRPIGDLATRVARGGARAEGNRAVAIELCEMCMARGREPSTAISLAEILLMGRSGDGRETERAVELCENRVATTAGKDGKHVVGAVVCLGRKLMNGCGVVKDTSVAMRLFHVCVAKRDSCEAMFHLAEIFAVGVDGVARDSSRAIELCERAARRFSAILTHESAAIGRGDAG